jgi:ribonuclease P protein component
VVLPTLGTSRGHAHVIRRQIYETARAVSAALPQAALVVRLRSEFSRKQFVSATSEPLKRAVRAELELLLGRVVSTPPVVAVPTTEVPHAG